MVVNKFSLLFFICQLFFLLSSSHRFDCYDGYCSENPCPNPDNLLNCENGILMKNATSCGCCHICVKILAENDDCATMDYAAIPSEMCGPKLICENDKCVPVNTTCMKNLNNFENLKFKRTRFGKAKPECDDNGNYNSTVCISDVLCYCVDKEGSRIFGTDVASRRNLMDCNCSRDFEDLSKKIKFEKDNFLRCLPNGNYDPLQCTDSSCYCMQDFVGDVDVKNNSDIKSLRCYDDQRHKEDDEFLRSKCLQRRQFILEKIERYENESVTVIGVDLPHCDLDGSYAPVQCKSKSCYCVSKDGKKIKGTEVKRNSEDSRNMTCRCVREKELIMSEKNQNQDANAFAKFNCTRNGNYNTNQNIGDSMITVDSKMGFQILKGS